jgi:hypothetical protein
MGSEHHWALSLGSHYVCITDKTNDAKINEDNESNIKDTLYIIAANTSGRPWPFYQYHGFISISWFCLPKIPLLH